MIYDLKFNSEHDLSLENRDLAFVDDENDAIVQRLKIRLQFLYDEWFLDRTVGIPYTQYIFEAGKDMRDIHEIFSEEIKNTEGVKKIDTLDFDYDASKRALTVNFSVNDGQVTENIGITV